MSVSAESIDQWDDRRLVGQYLARRDEASFRALYRRHSPAIFGLALRLSGFDREEAEDTLQETWIRACRKLHGFRWESSLRTWLCGIAVMRLRERSRSQSRRPEAPLGEASPSAMLPAEAGPGSIDLERALARLPEIYRRVLVLRDIQGYTHEEIAGLLEISPGTSKSQLFRARRILREILHAEEGQDAAEH